MRNFLLAAAVCIASAAPAGAAEWARSLFPTTNHDFGTVARAAKTEYRFEFENRSNQTIHVRSVRASCGCTTPIVETEYVKPGEQGAILARFNTGSFTGQRQATLTVSFDQPNFTEVQLQVKGYIRSDIVFNPGEAAFGNIKEGDGKKITVDVDYAGRNDWQLVNVQTNDNFITVQSHESSRANGRVKYQLEIALAPNAPTGPLLTEILLLTNDRNLKTVPLSLVANIEPTIAVSPQLMALGNVTPGQSVKQILIVKAQQPFRVIEIRSSDFDIQFDSKMDAKTLHSMPLTISANGKQGEVKGKIFVKTDLPGDSEISVDATCKIQSH